MDNRDKQLFKDFSPFFDFTTLYDKEKRRAVLQNYFLKVLEEMSSIDNYSSFVTSRRKAVFDFIENSDEAEKLTSSRILLSTLLRNRKRMRDSYAYYWSFDSLVKDHRLVTQSINEATRYVKGDLTKLWTLLTPGKSHCVKDSFSLANHIEKTGLIAEIERFHPKVLDLCDLLEEIVYAEGFQDWEVRHLFFNYAAFGLNLLRQMQSSGLYDGRDPLAWLNDEMFKDGI